MWNARHALISSRCAWCNRIWTGEGWLGERRQGSQEIHSHGICEACKAEHFPSPEDEAHLNVQRFRMRPSPAAAPQPVRRTS